MLPVSSIVAGALIAIAGGILSAFGVDHDIALAMVSGGLGMAGARAVTAR